MTRPTRIRIGALDYEIRWKDTVDCALTESHGDCLSDEQIICVKAADKPDRMACTFGHEIAHAIHCHFYPGIHDGFNNEHLAHVCGEGLVMVWRDNPEVFRWWVSLVEGGDHGESSVMG